jgi:hypothetical protein
MSVSEKKNFSSPRTSISCLHWFPWLIGQAPDFDLICIAGDLLDMFASETRHDHAFPYASGQSWSRKLDEVSLLVPGQLLSAPIPNYIELDTGSGELSWHTAASETWIPEDGLYDHLVLKLDKD